MIKLNNLNIKEVFLTRYIDGINLPEGLHFRQVDAVVNVFNDVTFQWNSTCGSLYIRHSTNESWTEIYPGVPYNVNNSEFYVAGTCRNRNGECALWQPEDTLSIEGNYGTTEFYVSGNLKDLCYRKGPTELDNWAGENGFNSLFYNAKIVTGPDIENLHPRTKSFARMYKNSYITEIPSTMLNNMNAAGERAYEECFMNSHLGGDVSLYIRPFVYVESLEISTNAHYMFANAFTNTNITSLTLTYITGTITSEKAWGSPGIGMFYFAAENCQQLTSLDINTKTWAVDAPYIFAGLCCGCKSLINTTSRTIRYGYNDHIFYKTFYGCTSLQRCNFIFQLYENVLGDSCFKETFRYCTALNVHPIFDFSYYYIEIHFANMCFFGTFSSCTSLASVGIIFDEDCYLDNPIFHDNSFYGTYDASNVHGTVYLGFESGGEFNVLNIEGANDVFSYTFNNTLIEQCLTRPGSDELIIRATEALAYEASIFVCMFAHTPLVTTMQSIRAHSSMPNGRLGKTVAYMFAYCTYLSLFTIPNVRIADRGDAEGIFAGCELEISTYNIGPSFRKYLEPPYNIITSVFEYMSYPDLFLYCNEPAMPDIEIPAILDDGVILYSNKT